jgi:hypothetical protein
MRYLILTILIITLSQFNAFSQTNFQQKVDYEIKVVLDDSLKILKGNISIRYSNNSGDTLKALKLHLWPNAYSDRNTALCRQLVETNNTGLFFATKEQKGWIDSLQFSSEGASLKLISDPTHNDIADLILNTPLLPGSQVVFSSPFVVQIPDSRFSRFGYRKNSYYISQWFPKPAVYDQNGWHPMPYLNQGEFYAEFGNFKVEITIPSEYRVAATGRLMTQAETEWLNLLASGENISNPSAKATKTIVFEQDSIHDFAWFADKDYRVMKKQIELSESSRKVDGWVFHTDRGEKYWKKSMDYIDKGLRYFSGAIGEYPYDHFTVVDGHLSAGGGMEYPMITLVNSPTSDASLEHVIVHELCHNWFYGMLASNEREHAWMDEGLTTYYETRYFEHYYSGGELSSKSSISEIGPFAEILGAGNMTPVDDHKLTFKLASFRNADQPIQTHSAEFTNLNYGAVVYSKTALALYFLHDYLGEEVFEKCIKTYFLQLKFRHPQPADLEKVFEDFSGKDLDWFFNGLIYSSQNEFYKIIDVKNDKITLKSESLSKIPVKIKNKVNEEYMWVDGFDGQKEIKLDFALRDSFSLNNEYHILLKNKFMYFNSAGKTLPPNYQTGLFYKIANAPSTDNQTLLPVVAWNRYNQWMAGMHLTNMDLIPEKTEFFLTPLFDFKNKQLTGIGEINHHFYPYSGLFSGVTVSLSGKRFAYDNNRLHSDTFPDSKPVFMYSRVVPSVRMIFRSNRPRSRKEQSLMVRHVTVWQDEIRYTANGSGFSRDFISTEQNISEIGYDVIHSKAIDPWRFNTTMQHGSEHLKITAELNYRFSFKKKNKGFDVRIFAGGFLRNETTVRNYNLRMSGWKGRDDYLFDEIYFGRNDSRGLWPNQFLVKDGGFKIATAIGQTRDWLAAVNLQADLPLPLPVKLYFDIGTFEGITTVIEGESKVVMFNGGLAVSLIKNTLEVYVPLFYSSDIRRNLEVNNVSFAEQIRFVFNIRNLAPVKLRDDLINSI